MNKGTLREQIWFYCRELQQVSQAASRHSHGSATSVPPRSGFPVPWGSRGNDSSRLASPGFTEIQEQLWVENH